MPLNIVMMATGEFALPGFLAVAESSHKLAALITQPDRVNPRGKVHPHPLKEAALEKGIPVYQPDSINTPEAKKRLQSLRPDIVLVAAYGQILKEDVINIPRLGMYNLHASLLPRHRGAAPIQYAVWKGDKKTGVTIFKIEPKLDAGLMIHKVETEIGPQETSGQLHDRLAVVGADAFLEAVALIESGAATPLEQDEAEVTQCPKIRKPQGEIDWSQTPREIDCHIRAMQPWPNPFTFLHRDQKSSERVLILSIQPHEKQAPKAAPGEIIGVTDEEILVQTGSGAVSLLTIQKAGKKPMTAAEYLRGNPLKPGDRFGGESK